jgi:hypothetical protein
MLTDVAHWRLYRGHHKLKGKVARDDIVIHRKFQRKQRDTLTGRVSARLACIDARTSGPGVVADVQTKCKGLVSIQRCARMVLVDNNGVAAE